MTKLSVLLDMDGVLADFVSGICRAHGRPNPYDEGHTDYQIETYWGISPEEFWKPTHDPEFWADLDTTPEARAIVAFAAGAVGPDNVHVCTAAFHGAAKMGKWQWLERHYPDLAPRMVTCRQKHLLARYEHILVDDSDDNVVNFNDAGGHAILVPRPWNRLRGASTVAAVSKDLRTLTTLLR